MTESSVLGNQNEPSMGLRSKSRRQYDTLVVNPTKSISALVWRNEGRFDGKMGKWSLRREGMEEERGKWKGRIHSDVAPIGLVRLMEEKKKMKKKRRRKKGEGK